jgi:hypothetical protein
LQRFKDEGYFVLIKDEQENGIWYRLKRFNSDITISLWMDNDGSFKFSFEDWT